MAEDKNIAIEVEVKGVEKSVESMKDLKNAIKSAKDEQLKSASTFGESSKEYVDASKKVSALKDKVDDLKDSTTSLAGSGLERAKNGLAQFGEGLMNLDFGKIKAGLTALKSALASTGIMLIVMAVSYLIANFEELSKGTGLLGVVLRAVGDYIKIFIDLAYSLTDALGLTNSALDAQREAMVANAEKAKEALGEQTKEYDRQMAVAKSNGESTVQIELQKQRAIQATNEMILRQLLAQVKAGQELDEAQKKLLTSTLESVKDTHTAIQVIENTDRRDKTQKDNKAHEERAAANKKAYEENKSANIAMIQEIEDAKIASIKDDEERAILGEILANERRIKDIKDSKASSDIKSQMLLFNELKLQENFKKIDEDVAAKKKADNDKIVALNKEMLDQKHAQQIAQDEIDGAEMVAKTEKQAAAEKEAAAAKIETTIAGLEAVQQLTDLYFTFKSNGLKKGSAEELANAKKAFQVNKALQLSIATVSAFQAVQSAFTTATLSPITTVFPAYPFLMAGIAGVTSAVNIAKIAASKFDAGGGAGATPSAGGGAPSVPIPSPPTLNTPGANTNSGTTFDETGKNTSGTSTITLRASIGVDEITAKTNRVGVLEKQATF